MLESIEQVQKALEEHRYIADRPLATIMYISQALKKPILLEGEAGVGKTEIAKVLAEILGTKLIRLQCYEGLDVNAALYEWNYQRQMLAIRLSEARGATREGLEENIFGEEFLLKRPLLEAIQSNSGKAPVLLIDEIDRCDEEFEAFLLEILSDFQVTIPEIGTIKAKHIPSVVLTSNRTREINDALKRRCLYHWIEYPSYEKELQIVTTKVSGVREDLAGQICSFMQRIRQINFYKKPGIAETLDWTTALLVLNVDHLERKVVEETLGCLLKYNEDIMKLQKEGVDAVLSRI
ncbi:MAG: MoxR family ATPase [Candidatus Tectomicrobia bacterium]|nr:MoxR family ATPase [Candidatus Tectomicrobia bacterium]